MTQDCVVLLNLLYENPSIILLECHCQLLCTAVAHANHLRQAVMLSYAMMLDHGTGARGGSSQVLQVMLGCGTGATGEGLQVVQMMLGCGAGVGETHIILLELEDGQVLQDVVLDACGILGAHPVLGCGPHKALGTVFVLHTASVASQVAVDVAQVHKHITVVALHDQGRCRHSTLLICNST